MIDRTESKNYEPFSVNKNKIMFFENPLPSWPVKLNLGP